MKVLLLCIFSFLALFSRATTVTKLKGSYQHGQVFLTWRKVSDTTAFYKVYRSTIAITSGTQLSGCEYLGYTDSHSSQDWNLTRQDGVNRYLRIDSAGTPLATTKGLFVATTLVNGDYYYAVTVMINGEEDQTIITGSNSLPSTVTETVSSPMPVFQEMRTITNESVEIYATFLSTKYAVDSPFMNKSGFLAFDFGLYRNHGNEQHPLKINLHGGGAFFLDRITSTVEDEMIIGVEDGLPSGVFQGWFGANENFDIYNADLNTVPPTTGTNFNHTQVRIIKILDWAFKNLNVDSNRVYINGTSLGAPGAYFMTITYPERFAAAALSVGIFNSSFDSDYQPNCSLNDGKKNRKDGDLLYGRIETNLPTNLGARTYEVLNGGLVIHQHNEQNFPFIFSINGKHDEMMGWTEKTFYYDSVNHNHTGGYYFWDSRTHNGDGGTWNSSEVFNLFRFSKNLSFPAFSDCSLNEDWGNGNGNTGEDFGSVNGSLDWVNEVADDSSLWQVQVFIRDLPTQTGEVVYPDSCSVTITPRRVQRFNPAINDSIEWSVLHHGIIIQSGKMLYAGGLITVAGIKIFKDTITFALNDISTGQTWYADSDHDGYGNSNVHVTAQTQPNGYVANHLDCNDGNLNVHPGATDICNSIDDNCDGDIDENAITATITPSGDVSICGGSLLLTANSGWGITYQWRRNGFLISGATNQTYSAQKTAIFYVVETNTIGCSATSDTIYLTILTVPDANITSLGNLDICQTDSVDLQANSGTDLTYQWKKGNSILAAATNQIYTATASGTYKVIVTNSSDCSKTSAGVKVIKSCKENYHSSQNIPETFFCYPNPSDGQFTIYLNLTNARVNTALIEIINSLNQIVYKENVLITNGGLNKEIDVIPNLIDGMYLVKVIVDDKTFSGNILIQR